MNTADRFVTDNDDVADFLAELIANMAAHLEGGYAEAALIVDESLQDNTLGNVARDFITHFITGWMDGDQ